MQVKFVSSKKSKNQILTVAFKIAQKSASKDFIKAFPTYFLRNFLLQHFSNRPYLNAKIILAHFYIIKTI